jgi:hypothetical protein
LGESKIETFLQGSTISPPAEKKKDKFCDVAALLAQYVAYDEKSDRACGGLFFACFALGTFRNTSSLASQVARLAARSFQIPPTITGAARVEFEGFRESPASVGQLSVTDIHTFFKIFSSCHFHLLSLGQSHGPGTVQCWQFFNALRSLTYAVAVSASFFYAWT